uniref:Uncharacterized protein n=1 Tax=Setaria italica TaxID=4555 RepID=K3Y0G3_SETIT
MLLADGGLAAAVVHRAAVVPCCSCELLRAQASQGNVPWIPTMCSESVCSVKGSGESLDGGTRGCCFFLGSVDVPPHYRYRSSG